MHRHRPICLHVLFSARQDGTSPPVVLASRCQLSEPPPTPYYSIHLQQTHSKVPEDTEVPLSVMSLIYDACGNADGTNFNPAPLSRLMTRKYLNILIDRSLVLGTVDRQVN